MNMLSEQECYELLLEGIKDAYPHVRIVETNQRSNDYPKEIRKMVVGFHGIFEAIEAAREFNLELWKVKNPAGHQFFHRIGQDFLKEGFVMDAESLGEQYYGYDCTPKEYWLERLGVIYNDEPDYEDMAEIMQDIDKVYNKLDMKEPGEIVYVDQNGKYYRTYWENEVSFERDGTRYEIAVGCMNLKK
jgi:hypothetical protein